MSNLLKGQFDFEIIEEYQKYITSIKDTRVYNKPFTFESDKKFLSMNLADYKVGVIKYKFDNVIDENTITFIFESRLNKSIWSYIAKYDFYIEKNREMKIDYLNK